VTGSQTAITVDRKREKQKERKEKKGKGQWGFVEFDPLAKCKIHL